MRLASMAALTLHWYNPLFHMLDRTVREVGEERCDEDVARLLNRRERLRYGQILLQMAAGSTAGQAPGVLCLSSREALERRLSQNVHTAPLKGRKRLLALLAAAAVFSCGTAAAWFSREPLITARRAGTLCPNNPLAGVLRPEGRFRTRHPWGPPRRRGPRQSAACGLCARSRTVIGHRFGRGRSRRPGTAGIFPAVCTAARLQRQRTPRKTPRNCA